MGTEYTSGNFNQQAQRVYTDLAAGRLDAGTIEAITRIAEEHGDDMLCDAALLAITDKAIKINADLGQRLATRLADVAAVQQNPTLSGSLKTIGAKPRQSREVPDFVDPRQLAAAVRAL